MHTLLVDAISDGGSSTITYFLGTSLLGLASFVAVLIRQMLASAQKQIDDANERTKVALVAGTASAKEERERADEREKNWLEKLDKVAAAQEELDDNVSNIHVLLDGMIRLMREREGAVPPATPSPPIRRRTQGGD